MMRTGKLLGLGALLAVLVAAGPVLADDVELKDDLRKDIQSIKDELRQVRDELAALRRMGETKSRLEVVEMRLLNERLERLERTMSRLSSGVSVRTSSSFSPGSASTMGTVRLVNDLPVTATVRINGVRYTVPALDSRAIQLPAGSFVWEAGGDGYSYTVPTRSYLAPGETRRILVYPPAVVYP